MVLILAGKGAALGVGRLAGDAAVFAATLCWAVFTLGVRALRVPISTLRLTALTMLTGAPGLLLLGWGGLARLDWGGLSAAAWSGVAYSTLLAIVVAYLLWNNAVRVVGSGRTAIFNSMIPLVAMLVAWPLLGEHPRPLQIGGAILIVSGVLLSRRPSAVAPSRCPAAPLTMSSILAIDQGTTGTTALVIHQDGTVIGRGYREVPQHFPRPGWVEHDPMDLFRGAVEAGREAMAQAGERPVGVGITNQRETVVLWDRATLEPLGRAIVWQDRRTAARCAELRAQGLTDMLRERTGLVPDPYFSATKLELLLSDRDVRRRAERGELAAGTVDSWLVARLTGGAVHVTDHTNASRTMLYGLEARAWDPELLALFGVPLQLLPTIVHSGGVCGECRPEHLGLALPIAGIAGDQQAALFGQGCVAAGSAKNTYGTGTFLLMHTGARRSHSAHGLLATAACGPTGEPAYALEGSVFIAGAAVQWLRDGLGLVARADESEALARSVPDTRWRPLRPGLRGARLPALGGRGAGHRHRAHAGHDQGAPGAGRAGGDGVQQRRAGGDDDRRRGARGGGAARGRRRQRQQLAHAVPGRRARGAGRAPRHGGNHGPGGSRAGGDRAGRLAGHRAVPRGAAVRAVRADHERGGSGDPARRVGPRGARDPGLGALTSAERHER